MCRKGRLWVGLVSDGSAGGKGMWHAGGCRCDVVCGRAVGRLYAACADGGETTLLSGVNN